MFTGLVAGLGRVVDAQRSDDGVRLQIATELTRELTEGDSVAVNGVCLTATALQNGAFAADVMNETLSRTSLRDVEAGGEVNLELPLRASDRLGGHVVQGHVDGTGTIVARQSAGSWETVRISIPPQLARYLVEKGSVAVDGISLTISALGAGPAGSEFEVSLIPETLARTTLGRKLPGEVVNLEVDLIAKYVERLLAGTAEQTGSPR